MRIVEQSVELYPGFGVYEDPTDIGCRRLISKPIYDKIQLCGKTAYQANVDFNGTTSEEFVRKLIKMGHESVLEHVSVTFKITTDRGISHEIVRHRLASYTQESTRYCNYSKNKFGNEITVIDPGIEKGTPEYNSWYFSVQKDEDMYNDLIALGMSPQTARSILPNSLKTEVVMTANLREWRHFIKLRGEKSAHPMIQSIAKQIYDIFKEDIPAIVSDITM